MEPIRVRLVFEDRHVLRKPQRREGLKRCWVFLRPKLDTVAALASHIIRSFGLHDSCPGGLVLSMDEFVLPPFESTEIFRDKDIVSIRKRESAVNKTIKLNHDTNLSEDLEIMDKQPLRLCNDIVEAEEFEKESGGYQSEPEECAEDKTTEAVSPVTPSGGKTGSKRKRDPNGLLDSKRKKTKLTRSDKYLTVPLAAAGNIYLEHEENHSQEDGSNQESPSRERRSTEEAYTSKANTTTEKIVEHITEEREFSRHSEPQESCPGNVAELGLNGSKTKTSSRNARRKQARRLWLRELKISEKKELIQCDITEKGTQQKSEVRNGYDHEDVDEEVVPVIVKPGHIRFEPLGQTEQSLPKTVETIKWNGTVSKKKGQKWGREKNFSYKANNGDIPPKQSNAASVIEENDKADQLTEFEKLFPLTQSPKQGDVIAYRVVELSSSWCPDLSSFRVGKVMSYDPTSMKIVLVQVPEYPISFPQRDEEGATSQSNNSLYNEDGSLEIDFRSLLDVRLFADDEATTTNACSSEREPLGTASAVSSCKSRSAARANHKANGVTAQRTGSLEKSGFPKSNKHGGGWEEICRALDEKKAELSQKEGWPRWSGNQTTTSASWSYRALRGSALGPTISLLRSRKDI